jgi:flagellar basal-body rod modification protein FlgD
MQALPGFTPNTPTPATDISAVTGAANGTTTNTSANALGGLDTNAFLKLMIAQLQNQDPMNPTDNNQLLQQVNEIRTIGATDKLTTTLDSVLTGQNLTSAMALVGKPVSALSDSNQKVSGVVDHVDVVGGAPKLSVGGQTVSLNNVSSVLSDATTGLNGTMNNMLVEQNVMSALSLIGKQINGTSDSNQAVSGVVSRVSVIGGSPKVYVGDQTVSLNNITDVLSPTPASPSS